MVYENSQTSVSAKIYCDEVISEWMRSSNQAQLAKFFDSVSLMGCLEEYESTIQESFSSTYKTRTGRMNPSISSYQLIAYDDRDKLAIKFGKQTIIEEGFTSKFIKKANLIVVLLVALAKRIPMRDIRETYHDVLDDYSNDNMPTINDILQRLKELRNSIIHYNHAMTAYTKFRAVLMKAGFLNTYKMINYKDESLQYPSKNKPAGKFLVQLKKSTGTTFDFGIRVDSYLDFATVESYLGNAQINALYEEKDVNNRTLHYPIVELPKGVFSITSWFGYYYLDLVKNNSVSGVQMPHLTVEPWDPSSNNIKKGNNNVPLVVGSTTSLAMIDVYPIYSYNRAGSVNKGVVTSSTFFGTITQLIPSLTEDLMNYLIKMNIGGANE